MDLKEKIAQAIAGADMRELPADMFLLQADAVMAVLLEQEPLFWFRPVCNGEMYEGPIHNNSVGGKMLRDERPDDWKPLYAAPAPAAAAVPDRASIESIAHRTCTKYQHGERPQYVFEAHTLMDFVRQLGATPAASAVPDGFREGVEAVARLIDRKAELYAIRFGCDDMGGLSFGRGQSGEIKMDHYTGLLELANEVRAMFAAAPKPAESTTRTGWPATHIKTGNTYRVVGYAINTTNAQDGQDMVIYEHDGKTFVRAAHEFQAKFSHAGPDHRAAAPRPDHFEQAKAIISTWPKWKQDYRLVPGAAPKCSTCNDHGMVGGPSYYAPDEGGEPCPDCAAPKPEGE